MPLEFIFKGERRRGYYMHDLYVDPETRKKGMGFFITMTLSKIIEEKTDTFIGLVSMSKLNLGLQQKRNYHLVYSDRYVKITDLRARRLKTERLEFLKILDPLGKFLFNLIDWVTLNSKNSSAEIKQVDRFDSRFDDFMEKIYPKIGISTYKNAAFLNWKYIDRPHHKVTVFSVEEKGLVKGYIVVSPKSRSGYPKGTIVDIMADPDDEKTIKSLLNAAIKHFKKEKVFSIHTRLTDARFAKVLKKLLFFKLKSFEPVLIGNLEKCGLDKDYIVNLDNWHLTQGESDGYMYTLVS